MLIKEEFMKILLSLILLSITNFAFSNEAKLEESRLLTMCKLDCKSEYTLLRKYAEQGSSLAEFAIAIMLYEGAGIERNIEKANRYLARAARSGEPGAQYQLGYFFEHGLYKDKNLKAARKWYYLASRKHTLVSKRKLKELDDNSEKKQLLLSVSNSSKETNNFSKGTKNSIEKITVVMDADFRQIIKAAQIQTCNGNCDPYWTTVLMPIIKLKS